MARLTEHEKQEIIDMIQADKPLPDKYRFSLFEDKRDAELVWNGKPREVCRIVLPFHVIETVPAPTVVCDPISGNPSEDQSRAWTNKIIRGDNRLILSSLQSGALREEIEKQGGIKLIYIDPPFDAGVDYSMEIEIGNHINSGKNGALKAIAYRDTWGKGEESFLSMIYERLLLMKDILAEDGAIYVHCDWRMSGLMRSLLDEIFGKSGFLNEIIWQYDGPQSPSPVKFASKHDTIYRYCKNKSKCVVGELYCLEEEPFTPGKYKKDSAGNYFYTIPKGDYTEESIRRLDAEGKIYWTSNGVPRIKKNVMVSPNGAKLLKEKKIPDVWQITSLGLAAGSRENLGYPTQKPEVLLERIIRASSRQGDLVADFFCGSGTTAAAAEKLGRKWIVSDLGKIAIHTTRKRMICVQRQLMADGQSCRGFDIFETVPSSVMDHSARASDHSHLPLKPQLVNGSILADAIPAFVDATIHVKELGIAVELTNFSYINTNPHIEKHHEHLIRDWTDWIDYWSVDFHCESDAEKRTFKNQWQSFRMKDSRSLDLISAYSPLPTDICKLAVKVVDIFGNEITKILNVSV
jgi:DNA modification methylase